MECRKKLYHRLVISENEQEDKQYQGDRHELGKVNQTWDPVPLGFGLSFKRISRFEIYCQNINPRYNIVTI